MMPAALPNLRPEGATAHVVEIATTTTTTLTTTTSTTTTTTRARMGAVCSAKSQAAGETPRLSLLEPQREAAAEGVVDQPAKGTGHHDEGTLVANHEHSHHHLLHYMRDEEVGGVVFDRHRRGRAGPGGGGGSSCSPGLAEDSCPRPRLEGRPPPKTRLSSFSPKAVGWHWGSASLNRRRVLQAPHRRQKAALCSITVSCVSCTLA